MIGINKLLLGDSEIKVPDYVQIVDKCNDDICFYFGPIRECEKLIKSSDVKVYFHDLRVSEFLPPLGKLCLNFNDSYYKLVCQLNESDFGNFCRGDDGRKSWSGQVLEAGLMPIIKDRLGMDELMFLSPCLNFSAFEYRCWVHEDRLIAYDSYCVRDIERFEAVNDELFSRLSDFVLECYNYYVPDELYVIDVCVFEGRFHVVEYNCFSTSGFCKANASLVTVMEYIAENFLC